MIFVVDVVILTIGSPWRFPFDLGFDLRLKLSSYNNQGLWFANQVTCAVKDGISLDFF